MANSLSAKKRLRQNVRQRARNRWRKGQVKDVVKQFLAAVHDGKVDEAEKSYRAATKTLDQIAATGAIHKNAASRSKSRLAKRLNALKAAAPA